MTNMVHLIPTHTDVTARDIAELYIKEIMRLHGLPESIVLDREVGTMASHVIVLSPTNRWLFGTSHSDHVSGYVHTS